MDSEQQPVWYRYGIASEAELGAVRLEGERMPGDAGPRRSRGGGGGGPGGVDARGGGGLVRGGAGGVCATVSTADRVANADAATLPADAGAPHTAAWGRQVGPVVGPDRIQGGSGRWLGA
jgi:hypothetical protein